MAGLMKGVLVLAFLRRRAESHTDILARASTFFGGAWLGKHVGQGTEIKISPSTKRD